MNKQLTRTIAVLGFVILGLAASAQPFANEIAAFKKQDSIAFPPRHAILFVGSSSFRLWDGIQNYFPSHTIINRGFGGSSLPDVIRYANDIIIPYHPKQIIIYCGENDLANETYLDPAEVTKRFVQLFEIIRKIYRKVPIAYISIKPSPRRKHLIPKFDTVNVMIGEFLQKRKRTVFIDVYHAMLLEDGTPMPDIFNEDMLHLNAKGYRIWQKLIEPHLLK